MMIGRVKGGGSKVYLKPREALLAGDMLRIGYEDESWHGVQRVGRYVPKHGQLYLKASKGRGPGPEAGTPVFLVDRMEQALKEKIGEFGGPEAGGKPVLRSSAATEGGRSEIRGRRSEGAANGRAEERKSRKAEERKSGGAEARKPGRRQKRQGARQPDELTVFRRMVKKRGPGLSAYWLSSETVSAAAGDRSGKISWWLPPVIWPKEEDAWASMVSRAIEGGARRFVLNAPWQTAFFQGSKQSRLWAGPFCNTANSHALSVLKELGFSGAVVSPELGETEMLALPGESPLPLGVVVSGGFPLSIARVLAEDLKPETLFASPKGEGAWAKQYGSDYWIFPNWKFDLTEKRPALAAAGYELFISMSEPVPRGVELKKRPGIWNWNVGLQ
jgi:putative protease